MRVRVLLACLAAGAFLFAQDTTGVGSIIGIVRAPSGVRVCLAKTDRCAVTSEGGAFRLPDLRPGTYQLEVTAPGRPAITSSDVVVRAGLESKVELTLPEIAATQQSITVAASVFVAPEEVKNSGYLVSGNEIFKAAGALQDVSRYVQTLPGVVIGSDDFRNDIIVRGGSPLENLFVVDNIEVPNINTFANFASAGGSVSILDAALIQDVTFLTGGYPASYINRTSSVLQVTQREGLRDGLHGRVTLGFGGGGAILEGPLKKGKGSWVVSARRSFLDAFTKDVGIGGVPVVYTFNAKAVYDLSPRDRVWAVNLTGVDNIRLGLTDSNKDKTDKEINNYDIRYDGWRSATGFNWQRLFGSRGVGLLGVTHSEASVGSSVKDLLRNGIPGATVPVDQVIASGSQVFRENSREGESTVKYDLTAYLPMIDKLQAGGSLKIFNIRYNTASPLGYDSPYSLVRDQNAFDIRSSFVTTQPGVYAQATRNLTQRLNLTWGGRVDSYRYVGHTRFSPRAGISYRITDKLAWRASFGSYYQQPFFQFLAVFPQNRALTPFRADHYVTGFAYTVSPTLRVTLEAYRKNYKDYPVSTQYPSLSLANIGDTFNIREILFPLTSAGRGRSQGVELFVEKKFTDKWFGQANIAFSRTKHAGLDGLLRPGSFDYPRVFSAVGGYRLTKKWELSARAAYLSGRPYTPFDVANSRAQNRGIYDLARVNAERLPDYLRLDLRVDRTFWIRDKPLLIFIGAQNVTNRKNVARYSWNRRTGDIQTGDQLGTFPLIGGEYRF